MKTWQRVALEVLLMIVVVPQAFVLCYFFTYFFHGGNQAGLMRSLALYALTISWVSAPFLAVLTLLVRVLIGARVRWFLLFPLCFAAGCLWVTAWNMLVYDVFSYLRSAVPILLCSVGTAGWAMARNLYLTGQMPQENNSKQGV